MMYVIKVYASGEAEAVQVPDVEFAENFVRENVGGAPEQHVDVDVFRTYPKYITVIYNPRRKGIREKENRLISKKFFRSAVGDALIMKGMSFQRPQGFDLEQAAAIIEEISEWQ